LEQTLLSFFWEVSMDESLFAVLLSIAMYILYVLLPLVPSVLIYRIFPDTKVSLTGPLAHLTLRASGAFAAYVVVVILCYFPVQRTEELIAGLAYPTWTVTGSVVLLDTANHPIPNQENMLKGLRAITKPELVETSGNQVILSIPGITDPKRSITIILPGFGQKTINMNQLDGEKIKQDEYHKRLDIGQIAINQNLISSTNYVGSISSRSLPDSVSVSPAFH
jgi:hypothetical protein